MNKASHEATDVTRAHAAHRSNAPAQHHGSLQAAQVSVLEWVRGIQHGLGGVEEDGVNGLCACIAYEGHDVGELICWSEEERAV